MKIVGCDLHTRYQQIAMLDSETGELSERRLEHANGEARGFYAALPAPVRVGIEATGHTRWFERMLAELGHELRIGDAAQIRASMVRKQKTDARDAAHLLQLLVEERFPRIWRSTMAERDRRQLVWHRQKLVWMRNAIGNQLQALAMGGRVPQEAAVHEKKSHRAGEPGAGNLGKLSPARVADAAGPTRPLAGEVGPRGGRTGRAECGGGSVAHASRGGSGDLAGLCADVGSGGALRTQQAGGELSGVESARVFFRGGGSGWERSPNKAIP